MLVTFLLLVHLLIFVYWLGGDLGAFYAATLVMNPALPAPARLAATKILNEVDRAPGVAMVLALPTGALLASARGWWAIPLPIVAAAALPFLVWLAIAWRVHGAGAAPALQRLDLAIRWGLMLILSAASLAGLVGLFALPLFIAIKLSILAATIALGLAIRAVLHPFGPALRTLMTEGATPDSDAAIHKALTIARPLVLMIWGLLLVAACLGLAQHAA